MGHWCPHREAEALQLQLLEPQLGAAWHPGGPGVGRCSPGRITWMAPVRAEAGRPPTCSRFWMEKYGKWVVRCGFSGLRHYHRGTSIIFHNLLRFLRGSAIASYTAKGEPRRPSLPVSKPDMENRWRRPTKTPVPLPVSRLRPRPNPQRLGQRRRIESVFTRHGSTVGSLTSARLQDLNFRRLLGDWHLWHLHPNRCSPEGNRMQSRREPTNKPLLLTEGENGLLYVL